MDNISNSFTSVLSDFRSGQSLSELSEALQKVVMAVRETGKAGSLTYTLRVKPASKGAGIAVALDDKIATKVPELDRESGIFFANDDGGLQRDNPKQRQLDLKVAEAPTSEIKKVVNG